MAVPLPWHCRPLVAVEAVRCHCSTLGLTGPTSIMGGSSWGSSFIPLGTAHMVPSRTQPTLHW